VNSLEEGKSYCLPNLGVRVYNSTKYLSYTANSSAKLIDDLEKVNEEEIADEKEETGHVAQGETSAVLSTSEYLSCKFCRSKAVPEDGVVAECQKCSAVMKASSCQQSKLARFVVRDKSQGSETTLSAFEPVLSRIIDGVSGRSLSVKLLMASPKCYCYNNSNVVFSVWEK